MKFGYQTTEVSFEEFTEKFEQFFASLLSPEQIAEVMGKVKRRKVVK